MFDFKKLRADCKRFWKKASIAGRNLPLTITSFGVLTCVEMFTAGGIIQTTTETVNFFGVTIALAALEIGLSYGCGILAILGAGSVAELKADPRPDHRQRAAGAKTVSRLLLVVPVIFFTNALAVQMQRAERLEYIGSERYEIDRETALGHCIELAPGEQCYVSSEQMAEAQVELRQADEVKTARIDGAWFMALAASLFVYGTLGWANTVLYKPKPETPWEAKERQAAERRARARRLQLEKRALEMAEAAQARVVNRPSFIRGLFFGLKSA